MPAPPQADPNQEMTRGNDCGLRACITFSMERWWHPKHAQTAGSASIDCAAGYSVWCLVVPFATRAVTSILPMHYMTLLAGRAVGKISWAVDPWTRILSHCGRGGAIRRSTCGVLATIDMMERMYEADETRRREESSSVWVVPVEFSVGRSCRNYPTQPGGGYDHSCTHT